MALNDATTEYRSLMENFGGVPETAFWGRYPWPTVVRESESISGTVITYEAAF